MLVHGVSDGTRGADTSDRSVVASRPRRQPPSSFVGQNHILRAILPHERLHLSMQAGAGLRSAVGRGGGSLSHRAQRHVRRQELVVAQQLQRALGAHRMLGQLAGHVGKHLGARGGARAAVGTAGEPRQRAAGRMVGCTAAVARGPRTFVTLSTLAAESLDEPGGKLGRLLDGCGAR